MVSREDQGCRSLRSLHSNPLLGFKPLRGLPQKNKDLKVLFFCGESGGARTLDTGLKRPVL